MLQIFNDEFFSFEMKEHPDAYDRHSVVETMNIMVDPQSFDLKHYTKVPFASFSINHHSSYTEEDKLWKSSYHKFDYFLNASYDQYSRYEDGPYNDYLKHFKNEKAHTIIFHDGAVTHTIPKPDYLDKIILAIAMPIKGIVAPVRKSPQFKLYNGAFITCKLFSWNDDYYNKLVYFLVDMKSAFSFQEYVGTDNDNIGILNNYYFSLTPEFDFDGVPGHKRYHVNFNKITSYVPYCGREDLFSKPDKNIFYLSDIPSEIIEKRNSIAVRLNTK